MTTETLSHSSKSRLSTNSRGIEGRPSGIVRLVQDSTNLGGIYGESFIISPSTDLHSEREDRMMTYGLKLVERLNRPSVVAPTYPEPREQAIETILGPAGSVIGLATFRPEGIGGQTTSNEVVAGTSIGFSGMRWFTDSELSDHYEFALSQLDEGLRAYTGLTLHSGQESQSPELDYVPVVASATPMQRHREVMVDHRERERLFSRLLCSFEEEAVEDGMYHPAEDIIEDALSSERGQHVMAWLADFSKDTNRAAFAASVLRCLGRHESAGTETWRIQLIRTGLATDDVEIRDAAVQAAESWGDSGLIDVLEAHPEPEPWLRQYICDVIGDLKE